MSGAATLIGLLLAFLFVLGAAIGSFLNVCIYRLGAGKSISWPPSMCGSCLTLIPGRENIPIFGYWMLRGRCPRCGSTFSMRYFLVELLTALVFVAIFVAEVGYNTLAYSPWSGPNWWRISFGYFPPGAWQVYAAHVVLASLLIVAFGTLYDTGRVPGSVVVFGVLAGLIFSLFLPAHFIPGGGLLGVIMVPTLLRVVNGLHTLIRGREGFGSAPVSVALLAGGFLGWEVSLGALILATALCLPSRRGEALGLALVPSLVIAWQAYPTLVAPWVQGWWAWLLPVAGVALFLLGLMPVAGPAPAASPR
jgi:leader peptidase (prepilin peptidase)/N-methyltransferase